MTNKKSSPLLSRSIQGTNYGFSGTRIEHLGATEYTLVGVAADISGSVTPFLGEMEACIKNVVVACRKTPRADNLMLRVTLFDSVVDELHGFRPLPDISPSDYDRTLRSGGTTALYDAAHNAIESVARYGEDLATHGLTANGIVFVLTDGADNASTLTAKSVKEALSRAVSSESLDSMLSVLVGVNVTDAGMSRYLADFKRDAGFSEYVELVDATSQTLSRLAALVTRSIHLQSVALGSGGAGFPLTF